MTSTPPMSVRQPTSAPPCAIADGGGDAHVLDARSATWSVAPASVDACRDVIRWADANSAPLVPVGGGTDLAAGNLLQGDAWCALSTSELRGIVEFSAADLTITARAGTPFAELQEAAAAAGQWLPYDPDHPGVATIGGMVACNRQRLLRAAFGAPRDRVLGLRVLLADGSHVRAGGITVKNVAGYDLPRLLSGSRGALGLITEVTIRTAACAPEVRLLEFAAPGLRAACDAALAIVTARIDPLALEVARCGEVHLRARVAANAEAAAWMSGAITEAVRPFGLHVCGDPAPDVLAALEALPRRAAVTVLPGDLPAAIERIAAGARAVRIAAASGSIDAGFEGGAAIGDLDAELRCALPHPGRLVWTRLPAAEKAGRDVYGPLPHDGGAMRAVKRALDPRRLFSPGRPAGRL